MTAYPRSGGGPHQLQEIRRIAVEVPGEGSPKTLGYLQKYTLKLDVERPSTEYWTLLDAQNRPIGFIGAMGDFHRYGAGGRAVRLFTEPLEIGLRRFFGLRSDANLVLLPIDPRKEF